MSHACFPVAKPTSTITRFVLLGFLPGIIAGFAALSAHGLASCLLAGPPIAKAASGDKEKPPAVYYVDGAGGSGGTGSDSHSGTSTSAAWLTLNRAFDTTKAAHVRGGDTLYIRGGTYQERLDDVIPSGTEESPTTITNYADETVTIKQVDSPKDAVVAIARKADRSYINILGSNPSTKRLIIDNNAKHTATIRLGYNSRTLAKASYITLQNLEVKNADGGRGGGTGLISIQAFSDHNVIDSCSIHDMVAAAGNNHYHGVYITGDYNTIRNSDVYNNSHHGIHVFDSKGAHASHNVVANNRVHDNDTSNAGGPGIGTYGTGNEVYNNLVWGNGKGIFDAYGASGTKIYSNTVYNNNRHPEKYNAGIWLYTSSSGAIVRNNLCYGHADINYRDQGKGTTADHNAFDATNPNFASTDPDHPDFLKLSPATPSSIRDAGDTLGSPYDTDFWGDVRPQGSAYDIGADEDTRNSAASRLPRDNLLLYRDSNGKPVPVKSIADWEKRRAEVVRGMESMMGKLPGNEKRCPLDMKIDEEVDGDTYVRRHITYASEPGSRVPAYLLIPKDVLAGKKKAPAVLCLHGTNNVVAHGSVVGLGTNPNRNYALELAQRGYVTLAPNYPFLAKYQPDVKALGWESGTLKAVWDNMRGLDLLESLPYVDHSRGFGEIGHSLGGHNSVYTAVFDDRITAVVSSCGLDSYLDYFNGDPKWWDAGRGWCQKYYMPRLANYKGRLEDIPFDFHEMIGALAPRNVLIIAPTKDSNFRMDSVDRIVAAARPIFKLYGHEDRLRVEHPDGVHDFLPEMRETAYKLFDAVLGAK